MSLTVEHIQYVYPGERSPVIRDVSFTASDNSITAIIGPNGAGKTTLIKAMLCHLKAKGRTMINGRNRDEFSCGELHRTVGYMTQEGALLSGLTVFNVVLLGLLGTLSLRVRGEDIEKTAATLKLLHLDGIAERPFYALSGGQRRMVDMAQTIVRDPKVLIMDEPTSNLDLANELQVLELISAYTHKRKTTTLLTLHDLNTAARFADKMVLLKDGSVYRSGTPEEVITEESIRTAYGVESKVTLNDDRIPVLQLISSAQQKQYTF